MESQSCVQAPRTAEQKAEVVSAFLASGLSLRKFARERGIALSSLGRWVRPPPAVKAVRPPAEPAQLLEIPNLLGGVPAPTAAYRVHFPSGVILEVATALPAEQLRLVAQTLREL